MATDRPVKLKATYSPVPASTYNIKEKLKWIFFEEVQYLYQNFVTVNSVALVGTLSITINGNEDTGVIEVSEKTERTPNGSTLDKPSTLPTGYQGQGGVSEVNQVGVISKMTMPFASLPSMPKVFNKRLFEQITSLGHLELMKKYAETSNTDESTIKDTLVESTDGLQEYGYTQLKPSIKEQGVEEEEEEEGEEEEEEEEQAEYWEEEECTEEEEEDKEDKKDEDYCPELGEDAYLEEEGQGEVDKDDGKDDDDNDDDNDDDGNDGNDGNDAPTAKKQSMKKACTKRKMLVKPVLPKKKGRRTAAKLSLKIKLKQLKKPKSKKVTAFSEAAAKARKEERRRYEDNDNGDFTCRMCHKQLHNKKAFKRHCDRHWKSFQCDQCGKPFASMDSLFHHKKGLHSSTKPYSCEECGTTFNFHHSYKLHMQKHSGERPYKCPDCDKSYLTATHLKAHRAAIHEDGTQNKYVCDTCGKAFTYRNSLKTHQMIHTGDRPFKCSTCKKGFVTRQALKTHEGSFHTQERNFQCDICHKYYKSEHLRNVHRRRHTSDVTRFMCDICGRQFMFKSNLDAHAFVHQEDRPFTCTICQKSFKCMSSLYTHQYTHKSTTPYKCKTCSKAFKTKNCVKAHEKRHNPVKNYMCSSCGSCFPDKGGMTKHIRTIHAPQKQFVCKFCGKMGTRADNMRTHIKSHGKEASDFDAADCMIEVKATSGESRDDMKEITAKSIMLSKDMKDKTNTSSMTKIRGKIPERGMYGPSGGKIPERGMYGPPESSSVLLPSLEPQSLVTYHPPGVLSDTLYQAPASPPPDLYQPRSSPPPGIYQPRSSPSDTYQPPLSPRNYPQMPATHGHPGMMAILNSSIPHHHHHHHQMEGLDVSVGQTPQQLMSTTDPGQMGVMERSLLSSGIAMSVHGQNMQLGQNQNQNQNQSQSQNMQHGGQNLLHGPTVFPPMQIDGLERGRDEI